MEKVGLLLFFFLCASCHLCKAEEALSAKKIQDSSGASSLAAGKALFFGGTFSYIPSLKDMAEAEVLFLASLDEGNFEAPFLLERLYLMRREKGDADRIIKSYETAAKQNNISAAARLFAIKKNGIYSDRDENAASAVLDGMYKHKSVSSGEISRMIARAYLHYAVEHDALSWFENALREKVFDIDYPRMLLKQDAARAVDVSRRILAESSDHSLKKEAGAILVASLVALGKNEEALKEAWRSLEYETSLPFDETRAPIYYALAADLGRENSQNGKIWLDLMLSKTSVYMAYDAVGRVFMQGKLKTKDADKKAMDWFKKSMEAGSPLANERIAEVYEKSDELRNIELALEHYKMALEDTQNPQSAQCIESRKNALRFLYCYYLYGLYELHRDGRKAVGYLTELAGLKDESAMAKLYVYNAEGFLMKKDPAGAMRIYNELKMLPGMQHGLAEAEIASAYRYARHETQKSNMAQLMNWLKRSSEQGNASSRFKLAIFKLATGESETEVKPLIESSANLGNIAAQAFVFAGRNSGGLFERDEDRAKLIYEGMLQQHGRVRSNAAISRCYERGMGTEKNMEFAKQYRSEDDGEIDEYFSDYL